MLTNAFKHLQDSLVKRKIPKNHESSGILDRKNHQVSNQLTYYEWDGSIQSASDTANKCIVF